MRTTLNLPDRTMKTLLRLTKTKTKTAAVTIAIEEYNRRQKVEELITLRGKLHFHDDERERESLELKKYENTCR